MKKILSLVLLVGIGINASANTTVHIAKPYTQEQKTDAEETEGIHFFKGTWKEALLAAKTEKKLIFLDAYASWCGPCKIMARNTFTKKEVGDFFNANFINVKMDMEKDPQGTRLSNRFRLQAYPTLYFVDGNEKLIHQELGLQKPKQLISIGEKVMNI